MTDIDDLIARMDKGTKPLVIYDGTRNETRKVLADDALRLQVLIRESAAALRAQRDEIERLLHLINMDWDCLPTCDSFGHDPECPYCNGEPKLRLLVERAERAEAERDSAIANLKTIEFSADGYCPACNGWNPKGRGCTPKEHTKTCWLRVAIDAAIAKGKG